MKIIKIIRKMFLISLGFSMYVFSSGERIDWSVSIPVEEQEAIAQFVQEHQKNPYVEKKTSLYTTRPQNVNQTIKTINEPSDENELIKQEMEMSEK